MYIFGGNTIDRSYKELWRCNLKPLTDHDWKSSSSPSPAPELVWELIKSGSDTDGELSPPAGIGHTSTCVGNDIVIFGGRNLFRREFNHAVYIFSTVTLRWRKLSNSAPVEGRTGHCVIPCSSGLVIFGGLTSQGVSSDVLLLNIFGSAVVSKSKTATNSPLCRSRKELRCGVTKRDSSVLLYRAYNSFDYLASTVFNVFTEFSINYIRSAALIDCSKSISDPESPVHLEEVMNSTVLVEASGVNKSGNNSRIEATDFMI